MSARTANGHKTTGADGNLNNIVAQGAGNLNDPIFKSSNARPLPGLREGGGGGC